MVMSKVSSIVFSCLFIAVNIAQGQTVIPNASFENWTGSGNYSDPTGWDTPNQELMSIPIFGISVVSKSTDHHSTGSFSAKLETKHLAVPSRDIPGFMTCGKFTINITTGAYVLSGGVPVVDLPTHLKGYYKYFPKGGDSCVIGIGLTRTTGAIKDTIGLGSFSTKDTITDWTPFSAWIDYISTAAPDTMNIIAMSTAQYDMTIGTTLYVDDLFLDYTVGVDKKDPASGISVYNDRETSRLMIFFDFEEPENTSIRLINMMGQNVSAAKAGLVYKERKAILYAKMHEGVYILEIMHGNKLFSKKFFLNQ
jgi:hypothetical protein